MELSPLHGLLARQGPGGDRSPTQLFPEPKIESESLGTKRLANKIESEMLGPNLSTLPSKSQTLYPKLKTQNSKLKPKEDYNGLEGFVYRSFMRDEIDFIPTEKFIARQRKDMLNKTEENLAILQRVSTRVDRVRICTVKHGPRSAMQCTVAGSLMPLLWTQVDTRLSELKESAERILAAVVLSGVTTGGGHPGTIGQRSKSIVAPRVSSLV